MLVGSHRLMTQTKANISCQLLNGTAVYKHIEEAWMEIFVFGPVTSNIWYNFAAHAGCWVDLSSRSCPWSWDPHFFYNPGSGVDRLSNTRLLKVNRKQGTVDFLQACLHRGVGRWRRNVCAGEVQKPSSLVALGIHSIVHSSPKKMFPLTKMRFEVWLIPFEKNATSAGFSKG